MLRCSKCGTINADGNNFCSSCGSRLDRTSIRCPKCGTMNAVGNIFCDNCQTQLVSPDAMIPPEEEDITVTPVKGISLPTRPSSDEEPVIPEWLQQLTDDVRAESVDEFPEEDGIDSSADDQASFELPDWLSDQGDRSGTQDLPDWHLPGSDDIPESEKQPASQPSLSPEPEPTDQDTLASAQEEDTTTGSIPDWLSVIADEIDAAASTPSSAPDIPEWLSSIAEDAGASSAAQPDQQLPGWLKPEAEDLTTSDVEQTTDVVEETDSTATEIPLESEPDWSLEFSGENIRPRSLLDKTQHEPSQQDKDTPDSSGTETPLPIQTLRIDQTDDDINLTPDWLSIPVTDIDTAEEVEEEQVDEEDTEPETGIPDWLSTLGEQTIEAEQTTTPKLSSQTIEANEDLPSWLSEINVPQAAPEDSQSVFPPESAEAITTETQQPETPAWLDEVSPPPDTIAMRPAAPAFIPAEGEEDQQSDEEGLELEADEDESFPSWLNELRLPEPDKATSDTLADSGYGVPIGEFFGDIDQITPGATDDLARAEVPEWLHDLKPPAGSPWPPLATMSSKEVLEVEEITPAEVPDWVQSLRPKPGEEKEKPPERVLLPEPAEIEGPLASIVGILPPTTAIDMPADYEVNLVKIPDNVIRQAQLWQQLLGQPRSAVRKVAYRRALTGLSSTIMRIILAAVFVLGSLAALWLLPPSNLAATVSMGNTVGPQLFVDSVDALQPGETAIVAVEYGWAQAEEMTAIANVILHHLMDQEVNVIAVSTMAEGTAVIPHLLESNKLSNVISGNALYLSGSASGIAGFLSEPDAQSASMLIVLSSQYERIRWWIEQNKIAAGTTGNLPLLVNTGLSASVGPLTAPYLDEHNTHGWVIGFQDSVNYQALRGLQDREQTRILGVLLVMHWSAIILLIIGFLYTLVAGKKRIA